MIAALYVAEGGPYYGLNGVVPYGEDEDARIYQGPWPVVAHPPCPRYGRFWKGQPGNIAKGKVERKGDDQGCFKCALYDVREGGWIKADDFGGWTFREVLIAMVRSVTNHRSDLFQTQSSA